jgi:type VI secretion system protein ImpH
MSDLLQEPGRYEFYQAMRLLENGSVPGVRGEPVGHDHEPRFEAVRLRSSPSLGFQVNAIESIERRRSAVSGAAKAADVTITFMGALGASGQLPWHYTEYVFDRMSQRDKSLRAFVDTLEHRSHSFHYRAWGKYRLPFVYEASRRRGGIDDVTAVMRALVGLGTDHLHERLPEGADLWLYFGGLFGRGQRTTAGLEMMLRDVTGHPVVVKEFVGRWQSLLPEECTRLGGAANDEYRNQLGSSLILGERVWDVLSGIHITIGPVSSSDLAQLVPRTGHYPWLGDLVKSYLGPNVDFEVVAQVEKGTVSAVRLGEGGGVALGGAAWIHAENSASYDADVPVCSSR